MFGKNQANSTRKKLIIPTCRHSSSNIHRYGRGIDESEEQFRDAPGEDTEESQEFPKALHDADQPKEGELSTSKSEGKTGKPAAQATEGAEAPPEETPPDPNPTDQTTTWFKQRIPQSPSRSSHRRPHPGPR